MNRESARNAFAKKLKQLMEAREMSQSDVAAKIWGRRRTDEGIDVARGRERLSGWISGKNFPDRETLEKLANALEATVEDLAPEYTTVLEAGPNGKVFVTIGPPISQELATKILQIVEEETGRK